MRKSHVRNIMATVLSVLVLCSMVSPLSAATIGNGGTVTSSDTTVNIPVGILMKNATAGTYYGPTVAYTFTVAPATPTAPGTIEDANQHTAIVHAGPASGVTVNTQPSFTSSAVSFTAAGAEQTSNLVLAVDLTKFTAPGVYRYLITDTTTDATLYAAGIERDAAYNTGNYDKRYLDVYIERDQNDDLVVAGYALLKTNVDEIDTTTGKSIGFIDADDSNYAQDSYTTYNVTVEKEVTGSMGDKNHDFPFAITVSSTYAYSYSVEGAADVVSTTTALTSANLKHGDTVEIKGLSPMATVTYTETNDTADTYTVSVDSDGSTIVAAATKATNATTTTGALAVSDYDAVADVRSTATAANQAVTFINNLESVSPTGLIIRFRPYLITTLAGGMLLLVGKRREDEEESE